MRRPRVSCCTRQSGATNRRDDRAASERFAEIAASQGGGAFDWATKEEERARLWQARHDAFWATKNIKAGKSESFASDVCVPISRLAELGAELKARKIKFYLIGTPGTNLMELVDASGGFFFELTNTPSEAEVAAISANLAATVAATLRSGATVRKTTRGETVAAP